MNNVVGTVAMTPPFDNEKTTNADFQSPIRSRFANGLHLPHAGTRFAMGQSN